MLLGSFLTASFIFSVATASSGIQFLMEEIVKSLKFETINPLQIERNEQCTRELESFEQAIANKEPWATRLIDTWAKVDSGYLSGNTFNFGDFDSCINFQHLQTRHCTMALSALTNSTLSDERTDLSLKHV